MIDWYWNWQDIAAIALVIAGIVFAVWMRRSTRAPDGCPRCPLRDQHAPKF